MAIHHMTIKQAEKLGISLTEAPPHFRAYHSATKAQVYGVSAQDAIKQAGAVADIIAMNPRLRYVVSDDMPIKGRLMDTESGQYSTQIGNPVELYRHMIEGTFRLGGNKAAAIVVDIKSENAERNEAGVPFDGAVAFREGIVAADNPFPDDTPECEQWYIDWDKAADAQADADDGKNKGGSVVSSRYRSKYSEAGHPTHCGDWLAVTLNNYCVGNQSTDLDTFERICAMNGVDTTKYNRTTRGWQGRLRMTGRNLLARRVFEANKIFLPTDGGVAEVTPPDEWVAAQKYKRNEK